jgi:SAM-dependent methyltransferase
LKGSFDDLVGEALVAPFRGWDFSWLRGRSRTWPLPWDYCHVVHDAARGAGALLDMGTGGGEVLSRIDGLPRSTVATESWAPNVPVARARLRPLGIPVVHDTGAPGNIDQPAGHERLPFRDDVFDVVANRHESFVATEVARVLRAGGRFVTQQVDCHTYDGFRAALGLPVVHEPSSWLPVASHQTTAAGLVTLTAVEGAERERFDDVGALVYYLRVVSWAIPEFSVDRCEPALRALHDRMQVEALVVEQQRFLLVAEKPRMAS